MPELEGSPPVGGTVEARARWHFVAERRMFLVSSSDHEPLYAHLREWGTTDADPARCAIVRDHQLTGEVRDVPWTEPPGAVLVVNHLNPELVDDLVRSRLMAGLLAGGDLVVAGLHSTTALAWRVQEVLSAAGHRRAVHAAGGASGVLPAGPQFFLDEDAGWVTVPPRDALWPLGRPHVHDLSAGGDRTARHVLLPTGYADARLAALRAARAHRLDPVRVGLFDFAAAAGTPGCLNTRFGAAHIADIALDGELTGSQVFLELDPVEGLTAAGQLGAVYASGGFAGLGRAFDLVLAWPNAAATSAHQALPDVALVHAAATALGLLVTVHGWDGQVGLVPVEAEGDSLPLVFIDAERRRDGSVRTAGHHRERVEPLAGGDPGFGDDLAVEDRAEVLDAFAAEVAAATALRTRAALDSGLSWTGALALGLLPSVVVRGEVIDLADVVAALEVHLTAALAPLSAQLDAGEPWSSRALAERMVDRVTTAGQASVDVTFSLAPVAAVEPVTPVTPVTENPPDPVGDRRSFAVSWNHRVVQLAPRPGDAMIDELDVVEAGRLPTGRYQPVSRTVHLPIGEPRPLEHREPDVTVVVDRPVGDEVRQLVSSTAFRHLLGGGEHPLVLLVGAAVSTGLAERFGAVMREVGCTAEVVSLPGPSGISAAGYWVAGVPAAVPPRAVELRRGTPGNGSGARLAAFAESAARVVHHYLDTGRDLPAVHVSGRPRDVGLVRSALAEHLVHTAYAEAALLARPIAERYAGVLARSMVRTGESGLGPIASAALSASPGNAPVALVGPENARRMAAARRNLGELSTRRHLGAWSWARDVVEGCLSAVPALADFVGGEVLRALHEDIACVALDELSDGDVSGAVSAVESIADDVSNAVSRFAAPLD